jgi:hypothetical protein
MQSVQVLRPTACISCLCIWYDVCFGPCVSNMSANSILAYSLVWILNRDPTPTLSDDFIVQLRLTLIEKDSSSNFWGFPSTDWSCRVTESNSIGRCATEWDRSWRERSEAELRMTTCCCVGCPCSRYRSLSINQLLVCVRCVSILGRFSQNQLNFILPRRLADPLWSIMWW